MSRPLSALVALVFVVGAGVGYLCARDTAGSCADACRTAGLTMASWDGQSCMCLAPPRCELDARAADLALSRADVAQVLLADCSAALVVCQSRGGGR